MTAGNFRPKPRVVISQATHR